MNNDIALNIFTVEYPDQYLGDVETDCATYNVYISEVHDTIRIKIGTHL